MSSSVSAATLNQDQFSRMAAALLDQAGGGGAAASGVDLSNRDQLMAFAEALVAANSDDSSCGEGVHSQLRAKSKLNPKLAPKRRQPAKGLRLALASMAAAREKTAAAAASESSTTTNSEEEEAIEALSTDAARRIAGDGGEEEESASQCSAIEEAMLREMISEAEAMSVSAAAAKRKM